jgi:4-hydroxy-2-oxoheptanedioate aldolase
MGVEGIDGCWVGPSDLALSLGVEFESKEHDEAISKIFDACDKSGKISGICCFNTGMTKKWLSKGALFVTSGADISFMMEGSNTTLKELGR